MSHPSALPGNQVMVTPTSVELIYIMREYSTNGTHAVIRIRNDLIQMR